MRSERRTDPTRSPNRRASGSWRTAVPLDHKRSAASLHGCRPLRACGGVLAHCRAHARSRPPQRTINTGRASHSLAQARARRRYCATRSSDAKSRNGRAQRFRGAARPVRSPGRAAALAHGRRHRGLVDARRRALWLAAKLQHVAASSASERLPDGSVLHLNTDSDGHRALLAHRASRRVSIGGKLSSRWRTRIRGACALQTDRAGVVAVGTQFDVYRKSGTTTDHRRRGIRRGLQRRRAAARRCRAIGASESGRSGRCRDRIGALRHVDARAVGRLAAAADRL